MRKKLLLYGGGIVFAITLAILASVAMVGDQSEFIGTEYSSDSNIDTPFLSILNL